MSFKPAFLLSVLAVLALTQAAWSQAASPATLPNINSMAMGGAQSATASSTPVVQSPAQSMPVANQAKPLPDPNQVPPMTQAESYIWFGNDAINGAATLIKAGRYVEALAELDKIIQRNVRLPEGHLLQGIAYMQMKDLTRAKQSFNTVMTIDRGYMGAYIYMADIAIQQKDNDQAKLYLQAIKTICQTTECAEYQYLKNALRTRGIEVVD